MTDHHPMGPSQLYKRSRCPGSLAMEAGRPEQETPESLAGKKRHEIAARGLNLSPVDRAALTADLDHRDSLILSNWWEAIDCVRMWATNGDEFNHYSELRYTSASGRFGTVDYLAHWLDRDSGNRQCVVLDLKGRAPCEPQHSLQLLDYATCTLLAAGVAAGVPISELEFRDIGVCIGFVDELGSHMHHTDGQTLLASWKQLIEPTLEACKKPDAPRMVGSHCRFCRAQSDCPERQAVLAESVALAKSTALETWTAVMTPSERGSALDKVNAALKWLEKFKERAYALVKDGLPVDGYSIGSTTKRSWKPNAEEVLTAAGYGDLCKELLSPAALEKVIGKDALNALQIVETKDVPTVRN